MTTNAGTSPAQRLAETNEMPRACETPLSEAAGPPRLTLVHSPDAESVGKVIHIVSELLLLGRDIEGPGFTVRDGHASRLHARCVWDGRMHSLRIQDAASRNGTFVNARRTDSVLLSHGDVIRVGDSIFVYQDDSPHDEAERQARAIARSNLVVLIQGETGSGKDHLARAIHQQSGRTGELTTVACCALPRDQVARELFGERGTPGKPSETTGLILRAAGGTLLLDEVGDSSQEVQLALLRFLDDRAVRPLGSSAPTPVDVRVVATAQKDLRSAVAAGTFRADLFARLSQATLRVAPLRERRHELLALAHDFARAGGRALSLHADAAEALLTWQWPFNLRELQSLIGTFLVVRRDGTALDLSYLAEHHSELVHANKARSSAQQDDDPSPRAPQAQLQRDRKRLRELLEEHAGNVSQVAKELGKPRAQIYRWMDALGLSARQFRP